MESIMKNVLLSSAACLLAAALPTTFPVTMSAQSGGGTIEGHVKLTGAPPRNAPIAMGADPNCLKINAGKRVVHETDAALRAARLALADAVRIVLATGLQLLGIAAPESM